MLTTLGLLTRPALAVTYWTPDATPGQSVHYACAQEDAENELLVLVQTIETAEGRPGLQITYSDLATSVQIELDDAATPQRVLNAEEVEAGWKKHELEKLASEFDQAVAAATDGEREELEAFRPLVESTVLAPRTVDIEAYELARAALLLPPREIDDATGQVTAPLRHPLYRGGGEGRGSMSVRESRWRSTTLAIELVADPAEFTELTMTVIAAGSPDADLKTSYFFFGLIALVERRTVTLTSSTAWPTRITYERQASSMAGQGKTSEPVTCTKLRARAYDRRAKQQQSQ